MSWSSKKPTTGNEMDIVNNQSQMPTARRFLSGGRHDIRRYRLTHNAPQTEGFESGGVVEIAF
jgi:hypothetical protein